MGRARSERAIAHASEGTPRHHQSIAHSSAKAPGLADRDRSGKDLESGFCSVGTVDYRGRNLMILSSFGAGEPLPSLLLVKMYSSPSGPWSTSLSLPKLP